MNQHVSDWLSVYYDGELSGARLRQVETHLVECSACRLELEEIKSISQLLSESPAVERRLTPAQFTAQVRLRLPRKSAPLTWQKALKIGWQFFPAGLLVAWAFLQAGLAVSTVVLLTLSGGWERLLLPALVSFGAVLVFALLLWGWLASWWVTRRLPAP